MNVTAMNSTPIRSFARASQPAQPAAAEPQDKVEAGDGGSEAGEGAKLMVGGVASIGLMIPCVYAGVIGGAVVGGMLGLGFGPLSGALFSHGVGGMLGSIWSSTSTVAKAGMIIGGGSGVLGAWATGGKLGNLAGRLLGGEKEEPGKHVKFNGPIKPIIGFITTGGGALAGGVGGGMLGASVASAGSLVHGLALNGFNMAALSSMPTAALIGGGIGLAAFGLMGAAGGFKAAKFFARGIDKITGAFDKEPKPPQPQPPSVASAAAKLAL